MSQRADLGGRRRGRVHPLFAELYLNDDPDDGQKKKRRTNPRKQAQTRQIIRPSRNR
jgi:hypothetical protein